MPTRRVTRLLLTVAANIVLFVGVAAAQEPPQVWQVGKASGDVWVVTNGAQNTALTPETSLKAGDSVRTGRSGRVLLRRGEETILVAPNSVVSIPAQPRAEATTIIQQAGSILLDVNKRDARTFEVETPYLVAAVKGTQFRVTVAARGADVTVQHGSVEVADVKTGKFALVLPGQSATVSGLPAGGLSLRGVGTLSPIRNGTPRATSIGRIPVPRGGLTAPTSIRAGLHVRPLAMAPGVQKYSAARGLRIAAPIGQVRLDINSATKGLAREAGNPAVGRSRTTIWSSNGGASSVVSSVGTNANESNSATSNGSVALGVSVVPALNNNRTSITDAATTQGPSGSGNSGTGRNSVTSGNDSRYGIGGRGNNGSGNGGGTVTSNSGNGNGGGTGSGNNGNGGGNGNTGNGNGNGGGNGNGNNGNGNGNGGGNGSGNNGNGNGNGGGNGNNAGNGNGNAYGRVK